MNGARERGAPATGARLEETSFSEDEVARLLAAAARAPAPLQPRDGPRLTLSEVERVASESGLDPSLVRVEALTLEASRGAGSERRLLGGPVRPTITRRLPVLDEAALDRVVERLRRQCGDPGRLERAPGVVTFATQRSTTPTTVQLRVTQSCTEVTIAAELRGAVGGLFGGLVGGLGGGLGGGLAFLAGALAVGLALLLGADPRGPLLPVLGVGAGLAWAAACAAGAALLARRLFGAHARKAIRRLGRLADALPEP